MDINTLERPQWFNPAFPYLGLMEREVPTGGPLFSVLSISPTHMPVVQVQGEWTMKPEVRMAWHQLDESLSELIYRLRKVTPELQRILPRYSTKTLGKWRFTDPYNFLFPSATGYYHLYMRLLRSREWICNTILKTRLAFRPLIALAKYAILLNLELVVNAKTGLEEPMWKSILRTKGFSSVWIDSADDALRVRRENCERPIGVFIHLSTHYKMLPLFRLASVPCWYQWNDFTRDWVYREKLVYIGDVEPNRLDVANARHPDRPRHFDPPKPSEKERGREKWGDTPETFLEKRKQVTDKRKATATATMLQSWSASAAVWNANPRPPYTHSSPPVFVWETIEDDHWVRKHMPRKLVIDYWDLWGYEQVVYNEVFREFDVCEMWGPDAVLSDDGSDGRRSPPVIDDSGDFFDQLAPSHDTSREHSESPPCTPPPVTTDWVRDSFVRDIAISDNLDVDLHILSPLELLESRFGFTFQIGFRRQEGDLNDRATESMLLNLGDPNFKINPGDMQAVHSFCQALLNYRGLHNFEHPTLWDLSLSASSVNPRRRWTLGNTVIDTLKIDIRRDTNDTIYYFLSLPENPQNWFLSVTSAVTVLQCLRFIRDHPELRSTVELTEILYLQGSHFKTLISVPSGSSSASRRDLAIRQRPCGWIPSAIDYLAYIADAEQLLRSPRGRAALLQGGIIWRLAVYILGVEGTDWYVGPEGTNFEGNICLDGQWYYDDELTEDELEIICGIYRVGTSEWYLHTFL